MDKYEPVVYVVDDEKQIRESLGMLLKTMELSVKMYSNAQDFLKDYNPEQHGCLVLDVRMPGMSGLELQAQLASERINIPIIIITGHGDVPMAVQAIKIGALDFIEKPFREQELLDSIQKAIKLDAKNKENRAEQERWKKIFSTLTPREREIVRELVVGKANKLIAYELGISPKTVDFHRANILDKLGVDSVVELVRLIQKLKIGIEITSPGFEKG
ncbi:MAG: response regulator transcription factor [Planctomycetota bacterium]|jgi:FixJ family two-component response regulator